MLLEKVYKEQISIELLYEKFTHRYLPKISTDLVNWKKIDDSMIKIQDNNKKVTLFLSPDVNSSCRGSGDTFINLVRRLV